MKNLTAEQAAQASTYKTANLLADLDANFSEHEGDITTLDAEKADIDNPTFTGVVGGITKDMVGLGNVDDTSDINKPVSTAQQTALDLKSPITDPTFIGTVTVPNPPVNANDAAPRGWVLSVIGTGMAWAEPVIDIVAVLPILGPPALGARYILNVDNHIYVADGGGGWTDLGVTTTGTTVYVSSDVDLPANNVGWYNFNGVTWVYVGASGNHNDTTAKDGGGAGYYGHLTAAEHTIATQSATTARDGYLTQADWDIFNNKAPTADPTFTGTVTGVTKAMVGLGNVDNTSDANKPISTLTQNALDLKAPLLDPTFTGTVTVPNDSFAYGKLQNVSATDKVLGRMNVGAGDIEEIPCTAAGRALMDDATSAEQRTTIGLGNVTNESKATMFTNPAFTGTTTGITKTMVGLGNCDNTSDANKPVSTATSTALGLKANIASPTLTGIPAAPTAAAGTNTTQIATTAFVTTAVAGGTTQYRIFSDGVTTFREGVRNTKFVLDQTMTVLGFSGAENTDWANIRSESL